jgi:hypothetical protein
MFLGLGISAGVIDKNLREEAVMRLRKSVLITFLVLALGLSASAQIIQTGTMTGSVKDKDRGPLPGVSVTIKSPNLMAAQLSKLTNEKGDFRFSVLPPGLYSVTFTMSGFKTFIREGVQISVGQTVTLNETLEMSSLQETVTVRGEAPVVDVKTATMTSSYSKEFLEQVPTQRIRIGNYFALIPGASNDTYHGSTPGDQAFMVDGVNISDPLSGAILASWGFDIMEELSVDTGALRAEFGNVRGAVINAITKSGGNEFSGLASFYFRNKSFQADNTQGTPLAGRYVGFRFEDDLSFQFGGPVVKNKLWFFTAGQYFWYEQYVAGFPYNKPNNVPTDFQRNYVPYIKLSWQLDASNKLVFSYNYKNFHAGQISASQYYTEDTTGIQNNPDDTFNFQWTKTFSGNFFMDVKMGYVTHILRQYGKHDTIQIYDSVTRLYSGNFLWDDNSQRPRLQFTSNATYFVDNWLGSHEFKTGFDAMYAWYRTIDTYYKDPITGLGGQIVLSNGVPSYLAHNEDFDRKNNMLFIGGFVQDSWHPIPRLSLNIGVRYDHQEGIVPVQGQNRAPVVYGGVTYDPRVTKMFKPMIWDTLSPRFGLAYSLTNDSKTVLKASFARYYLSLYGDYFGRDLNPNSSVSWRVHLNPDRTPYGDPYNFSAAVASKLDPNLKTPYLDEFTIGIEREILADTKLSLRYIKKWDRNIIEDTDMNALDTTALATGQFVWMNYTPYTVTDPYNGQQATFYGKTNTAITSVTYITNPPGAKRDYDGLEIILNKRYSNRWQLFASYVYAYARGNRGFSGGYSSLYDNPNTLINVFGKESSIFPHQIKVQATWGGPWGVQIGGYFLYMAGAYYTRTIRSGDLGLNLSQGNTTILAEPKGSRKYPAQKTLDLRAEKDFTIMSKVKLNLMLDVFNVFNSNTTTSGETISSSSSIIFQNTTAIPSPRIFRLGVRLGF